MPRIGFHRNPTVGNVSLPLRTVTDSELNRAQPSITVVAPVFNEEQLVETLVARVMSIFDEMPRSDAHRLVVVDDGSSDATLAVLKEQSASESRLVIVSLSRNFGHQAAVSAGLDIAANDVAVVIDGDLQDDPAHIPRLVEAHLEGYDVVYAIRRNRKEPAWLRFAYSLHYRIANRLTRPRLPRDAGDFALLSRRVVDAINSLPERQRYVRGLRAWVGFSQIGIEIDREPRAAGESKYSLSRLINLAFDGLFSFSVVPIRVALVVGGLTMLAGVLYAVVIVVLTLAGDNTPRGFTSIIVLLVVLNGMVLIFLGVVGEYVGRIYEEVKGRPSFVIDEVIRRDGE